MPAASALTPIANWDGGGWAKETFCELDPDVVLMDPNYMHGTGWDSSWDETDTAEIRTAVALARDDLSERYWRALGELYVGWVVDADRYGGPEWHDDVDAWFDREIAPGAPDEVSRRNWKARAKRRKQRFSTGVSPSPRARAA